ncbi:MAG TPA: GDSL-type esterase/lipase family protein [Clostridia bacterium]|nr:GDSL-type esterase/lipase family protein [Clostridia bacterium]HRX41349.1 GDSL-type esterase/lipase family protein [Clostridia bacterium]
MRARIKILFVLSLALILLVSTAAPAMAAPSVPRIIDYVALGDSGAAGVRAVPGQLPGWEEGSDYGYTDNIARWLSALGVLGKFNEDYSISGNTAAQLAVDTSTAEAHKILKKAELVTITIGANDVLAPLYAYYYACMNGEDELTYEGAMAAIYQIVSYMEGGGAAVIQDNIETVLENVLDANPNARIYVMGYYNPLPCLVDFGFDAAPYVMMINSLINAAIYDIMMEFPGAVIDYIDTMGFINGIRESVVFPYYTYAYGPNFPYYLGYLYADMSIPIADIHLTAVGYLRVSLAFIKAIEEDFDFMRLF